MADDEDLSALLGSLGASLPPPAAAPAKAAAAAAAPAPAAAPPRRAIVITARPPAPEPRRRAGRPSTRPPLPPRAARGLVAAPQIAGNAFECSLGDPMMCKALFNYLKGMKATDLHLFCRTDGLTVLARDQARASRIVARFAGAQALWWYCGEERHLCLDRERVEEVFGKIDTSYDQILLAQPTDDPDTLTIVLSNSALAMEREHKVSLSNYGDDPGLFEAEETVAALGDVPLAFTLEAKQFKKTVGDAHANGASILTIEKVAGEPLQFVYAKDVIDCREIYRDGKKISLTTNLAGVEAFRVAMKIDDVKPLSAAILADGETRIHCRLDEDILFQSAMASKALVVSTLVRQAV